MNNITIAGTVTSTSEPSERDTGTRRHYFVVTDEPLTPNSDAIPWDCCSFGSAVNKTESLCIGEFVLISGRVSRGGAQRRTNVVVSSIQVLGSQDENESQESST